MLLVCLSIGLILRDLAIIQFAEDGIPPDNCGDFLQDSLLGWPQAEALLKACGDMELILKSCLGQVVSVFCRKIKSITNSYKQASSSTVKDEEKQTQLSSSPKSLKIKGKQPSQRKGKVLKTTKAVEM